MTWLPKPSKWLWWVVGVLLFSMFFGFPIPTLSIGKQEDEDKLLIPLLFNKNFSTTYTHSVHKTPVKENFVLVDDQIFALVSTEYQSLGVGTPFLESEGNLENRNGVFVLTGVERKFKSINIAYMPLTQQGIYYKEKYFDLAAYFMAGNLIEIKTETYTMAQLVWQKIIGEKEVDFGFEN